MHMAALLLPLCLPSLGTGVVLGPTSPANMNGAIDSTEDARGPLFLDHDDTLGAGTGTATLLAQTTDETLQTATGISLAVRANTVVAAFSYGLTDQLDASLVLPIIQEQVTATVTGPLVGHTYVTFSGPSDLGVRLKYRLTDGLAATLKATFPTGDHATGLGAGAYFLSPGVVASTLLGPVQANAMVAYNVNLSFADHSSISYGAGLSTLLLPQLGAAVEFLGESGTGAVDPLLLFGTDYSQRHLLAVAFGLRWALSPHWMVFAAGSYTINHDGGLRDSSVFPTLGIGGRF